jgi:hypothetical protein
MIPVNGPGDRVIGEVSRAQFPRENFQFQNVINGDLDRAWSLSNNSLATKNQTERSAAEINAVQGAGAIRLDYGKDRVNRYIADGCSVLFSLMQMFMEGTDFVEDRRAPSRHRPRRAALDPHGDVPHRIGCAAQRIRVDSIEPPLRQAPRRHQRRSRGKDARVPARHRESGGNAVVGAVRKRL